jgi:type IV secretion system protein TrbE
LTCCSASDPASQTQIDALLAGDHAADFADAVLRARDLDWAADLLTDFIPPPANLGDLK